MFLDRHGECAALDQLVEAVRTGESRALVLRGEPGVGKTALLDYLVERASGCRVLRAAGSQSEMELAFAGLHQLCAALLDRLERLPGPQRDALGTAFGLTRGRPPDRFLVALAVLGLLAEAARERPLVCVTDDAQWLDYTSVQTLTFVARRLVAESVALVFAARVSDEVPELAGLPQLQVEGLPDPFARELLDTALSGPVDDRVRERIVAEARGNPLALVELPRGLTQVELAGGFSLPTGRGLPGQIEQSYLRRLETLPADTQSLSLVAAAEQLGDPVLVWRAAERLGIGLEAAAPAAEAGLLEIGERVRFRHPLLRSAIYGAASGEERRSAHRALAAVTDPETDPDRRAWHAAEATPEPDEDVAAELERSAGRARARGGLAAAAAFLQRAAELTPESARRARRALAAAEATHQAGMPDAALRLLSVAEAGLPDKLARARAKLLRGQIAFTASRGDDAVPLLLNAASELESVDVALARETYLEAIWASWSASPLTSDALARDAAEAVRTGLPAPEPPRAADLLLDGLAIRFTAGYAAAIPMLKRALRAFRSPDLPAQEGLRWLHFATTTAAHLWDDEAWEALATRHVQLARDAGALAVLPIALNIGVMMHAYLGELAAAASLAEEQAGIIEATGIRLAPYGALVLAGWRGRETEADELFQGHLRRTGAVQGGTWADVAIPGWANALLYNSLGRCEDALAAAQPASTPALEMGLTSWAVRIELVEAASRTGNIERAADSLQHLIEVTGASGSEWALGIRARCRALLADGPAAESAYREAIDRLGRTRIRGELARSHLLYGEWLRRENRRLDAREPLRAAHDMFTAMGAEAFAERTARELGAAGESPREGTIQAPGALTAQETQIARLVREGLSNPEIAARLFISPRTVEWHLTKIFTKLNITSRRQLRRAAGSPTLGD